MLRQAQSGAAVMREIGAANVLEWNVELDRSLRSGAQVEAAMKLGPRLLKLSQEPVVAEITASLFKLEAGQDQILANAIVRRLADAFQFGNNFTRLCIVKVFVLELKGRTKCSPNGWTTLFSKQRIPNYRELLRKVKAVLDSGDVTARALALRLLGCLAELARDSIDMYRLVLEALQSPHSQEVRGAYFAMACLCQVSDAFSWQALEKIVLVTNAMETPPEVKRMAIRLFAKMNLSPQLSLEAHEAGKRLMLRLPTEDIVRTTLVSLTDLASQALEIMEQQVKLLLSYVSSDPRSNLRAVALKCLIKIAPQATHTYRFDIKDVELLLSVLSEPGLPSVLHLFTLQLVEKLLPSYIAKANNSHLLELVSLSQFFSLHCDWEVVQASLSLSVDLVCALAKLGPGVGLDSGKPFNSLLVEKVVAIQVADLGHIDLPTRVSLLVCDQVAQTFLLQLTMDEKTVVGNISGHDSTDNVSALNRCHALCLLLTRLLHECPRMASTIVDYVAGILESIAIKTAAIVFENEAETGTRKMEIGGRTAEIPLCLQAEGADNSMGNVAGMVMVLSRSLFAWVTLVAQEETAFGCVCSRLHGLANVIAQSDPSGDFLKNLLPALVQASVFQLQKDASSNFLRYRGHEIEQEAVTQEPGCPEVSTRPCFMEPLSQSIFQVAEKMKSRHKYWAVYKVAEQAAYACQWRLAESMFLFLRDKVLSEGSYLWLKSLVKVSTAEAVLRQEGQAAYVVKNNAESKGEPAELMNVDQVSVTGDTVGLLSTENFVLTDVDMQPVAPRAKSRNGVCAGRTEYAQGAVRCLPALEDAIRSLRAGVCLERTFEFQRWLLTLRHSVLQRTAELIGLVEMGTLDLAEPEKGTMNSASSNLVLSEAEVLDSMRSASRLHAIAEKMDWLAYQFKRLSEEFDLLCLSFMGIDQASLQILSQASLSCSLMAFCIISALFPKLSGRKPESTSTQLDVGLTANDLLQRLELIYGYEWDDLVLLCVEYGAIDGTSNSLRASSYSSSSCAQPLLKLCKWAIKVVLNLHKEAADIVEVKSLPWLQLKGLCFLKDLLDIWTGLPWLLPKFFFKTRPRAGIEVLVAQLGGGDMSISEGSSLSLGLGFQVVYLPPRIVPKSLLCVLSVQPAKAAVTMEEDAYAGWRTGLHEGTHQFFDMAVVEELVLRERGLADNNSIEVGSKGGGAHVLARCFVSLLVDETGRGFASCVLDLKDLSCGVYQICVQSVCTDRKGAQWSLLSPQTCPTLKII